jgi:hypothetical protein
VPAVGSGRNDASALGREARAPDLNLSPLESHRAIPAAADTLRETAESLELKLWPLPRTLPIVIESHLLRTAESGG